MAPKTKKGTEDDVELATPIGDDSEPSFKEDVPPKEQTGLEEDSGFYTMGDIKVDEAEESADEEFKKASKTIKAEKDEDDEEWVDDDSVNKDDSDDFLDEEGVDWENYQYEKDNY